MRASLTTYARFSSVFFTLALFVLPLNLAPIWLPELRAFPGRIVSWVIGLAVNQLVVAALVVASNDALAGIPPNITRSFNAVSSRLLGLLATGLLRYILTIVSLIAFPYFLVRWAFINQAIMIDEQRGWDALDRSSALVSGYWWRTFWMLVGINIVGLAISFVGLFYRSTGTTPNLLGYLVWSFIGVAIIPFVTIAYTLLYYDLTARQQLPTRSTRPEWVDA